MNPAYHPTLAQVHADVWHADALATSPAQVLPTGDAALDAQLPGGGWPVGALSEILQPAGVHSEWRLLLPALAHSGSGAVVLVGPPQPPFAPALAAQGLHTRRLLWVAATLPAQRLWAAEQALRCADVDAVLAWLPQARADQLRRLQMAAASFNKLLWVLRPEQVQHDSSPAVLRVWVVPVAGRAAPVSTGRAVGVPMADASMADGLALRVLKRRGPPLAQALRLHARSPVLARLLAASQCEPALQHERQVQPPVQGQEQEHTHALDCLTAHA